ncbi:hypothetical protein BDZ97DRAFT_84990 [Flammula alnicola]|nr:hypothetical protein BDZ97DRAFT_84990 [Flammula alnicola]
MMSFQAQSSVQTDAMQVDAPSAPLGTTPIDPRTVPVNYAGLMVSELKAQCKERKLRVSGRKNDLVSRLEGDDKRQMSESRYVPFPSQRIPNRLPPRV